VWSARAKYELALTLLSDGKPSEARTQFKAASSSVDNALAAQAAAGATGDRAELQTLTTLARVGDSRLDVTTLASPAHGGGSVVGAAERRPPHEHEERSHREGHLRPH
jgi:hypothetical protein